MTKRKGRAGRLVNQVVAPITRWGYDRLAAASHLDSDRLCLAVGRCEAFQRAGLDPGQWHEAEFKVFSQWNEDGLIQHLIRHVPLEDRTFVEFGVDDYRESNTRFLLEYSGWSGVVFDGGSAHRKFVYEDSELGWRYPINARTAFLTTTNINDELLRSQVDGDIGLLSIDIDGNDYWVWDAITSVWPRIVIAEFNSTFGSKYPITVPYAEDFDHATAHYSRLYFGASLPALVYLAQCKGYRFVGCESHGANAFFVREDVAELIPAVDVDDSWVESQFRSSRDRSGRLTYITDHRQRLQLMADLVVEIVPTGERSTIGDLFSLDPRDRHRGSQS